MPVWKWSQTAATNATADSTINWAEGQAPSTVNDSARAVMAAVKKWQDDISLATTTGGSSTAYTLTSQSTYDSLAHLFGAILTFSPHTTNTGNPQTTLQVDGLAAQPIRSAPTVEIRPGDLQSGGVYMVQASNGYFSIVNFNNSGLVPVGSIVASGGGTLPAGWLWCDGSSQSRTTFAALFAVIGTFWGSADGSHFNLPNFTSSMPLGSSSGVPSTAGAAAPTGSLTNTNPVGVSIIPQICNYMIKF